ncbi:monovalent cation/H+ antiporter subunit D [Devosia ginsengisoli]|uniref:Monovalent cation/H+ antiporter subunit D n=1 Tax=Devosia ginsengisoli TaxID=400770 RepID=A0A5B8LUE6_9HYPH|nr:monovalent cation/H+ antiporter subunit D [Devosia ginsengisoli]QDZ11274.1 monovalent cation/H+ antiporter subunit D [Devosia ginsengisoli]
MESLFAHIAILPIVLPLLAGIVLVLIEDRHHRTKLVIDIVATVLLLVVALALLVHVNNGGPNLSTYRLGDWPVPFGIVLVADPLAALMVLLTAILGLSTVVFSAARWHRAGSHFHSLFQLLLMGLNGAFLTGDLFNLFVFFEVLLAASYGLMLHGSGTVRIKAGLHYIAVNLATSSLFLIGVSLIYGVTGTLNMADLAHRIPLIPEESRMLFEAGAAILGIAFLVKAGMWPLSFWLPTTYAAASPPVAAMFAIMSKVGIYVVLRLSLLLFGEGAAAHPGEQWLLYGGMATIAFGTVGVLSSQGTARMAAFCVLVSSGTLLAMIGYENAGVTAGALFYLVSSTLALSCLFLLSELVERGRGSEAGVLAVTLEAFGDDEEPAHDEEIGIATPLTLALLGIAFLCCALVIAGMPPFSGFIAKFAMIGAVLNPQGLGASVGISATSWALVALLIVSGLAATIALLRAGINIFWVTFDGEVPRVSIAEMLPVLLLLGLCVILTVLAGPAMAYMQDTAQYLHVPTAYVDVLLGTSAGATP